jgi:hypothetical protein
MFSVTDNRVASELSAELGSVITQAIERATKEERELVELAGQVTHTLLGYTDGEHVLEYSAYGARNDDTGEVTFNLAFRARPVRTAKRDKAATWNPSQGPLVPRSAGDGAPRA